MAIAESQETRTWWIQTVDSIAELTFKFADFCHNHENILQAEDIISSENTTRENGPKLSLE